jgi:methylmalonyl-CoA mutase N-terminal domain/subunit
VIAHETDVVNTADPLGGSYYVEALTDEMDRKLVEIMADIEEHGGMARAVEEGYVQSLIGDEAWRLQAAVEAGERPVVGVNRFATDAPVPEAELYEPDDETLRRQLARLAGMKGERDGESVASSLRALRAAAETDDVNLMGPLVDCANAYCTVGEIVAELKDVWGEFRQPVVF